MRRQLAGDLATMAPGSTSPWTTARTSSVSFGLCLRAYCHNASNAAFMFRALCSARTPFACSMAFGLLPVRVDLGNLDVRCLHGRYGLRRPGLGRVALDDGLGLGYLSVAKVASDGESLAPGPAGVIFSKHRSSSTGTGM